MGTSTEDTSGTTCNTPLLTTFMRAGKHNDKSEVVKLQTFLNTQLGLNVPVTGFFGSQTTAGVNAFQIKYQNDVLSPWAAYGHDGTARQGGGDYDNSARYGGGGGGGGYDARGGYDPSSRHGGRGWA